MENRKKERVRSILSWVLAAFTGVMLTLLVLFFLFDRVVCRDGVYRQEAEKVDYAGKLRADLKETYRSVALTSGIPETLTDSFVEENVPDEIALFPLEHLENRNELDLAAYQEAFFKEVSAYAASLEEKGELFFSSEEERQEMENALADLCGIYTADLRQAVLLRGIFSGLESVRGYDRALRPWLYAGFSLLAAAALGLLVLIDRKKVFRYLYAAFASAGLLCITASLAVRIWNGIPRLALEPDYLKDWVVSLSGRFLSDLLIAGIALLFAGILFGAVSVFLKPKTPALPEEPVSASSDKKESQE